MMELFQIIATYVSSPLKCTLMMIQINLAQAQSFINQGSRWRSKNSPNSKNKYIWLNKNKSGEKTLANF